MGHDVPCSIDSRCVAYVIGHLRHSDRLYVGLTSGSAFDRVMEHVYAARARGQCQCWAELL